MIRPLSVALAAVAVIALPAAPAFADAVDLACPVFCYSSDENSSKFGFVKIPFLSLISADRSETENSQTQEWSILDATVFSLLEHESEANTSTWRESDRKTTKFLKLPLLTFFETETTTQPNVLNSAPESTRKVSILKLPVIDQPLFGWETGPKGTRVNFLFLPGIGGTD